MLRTYIVFILVVGILGSLIGRGGSHSAHENEYVAKARDAEERELAQPAAPGQTALQDGTVELDRSSDGHFYADVQINGATVHMLVDTGATGVALSREDARSAGVATSIGMNEVVGRGADGDVRGEFVSLDRMELGGKRVEGVEAIVFNSGEQSLLGQSFLSQFSSVEIQGDKMVLR